MDHNKLYKWLDFFLESYRITRNDHEIWGTFEVFIDRIIHTNDETSNDITIKKSRVTYIILGN